MNMIKNQTGSITADFLFAFVLVVGFSGILFALTLTLTTVEITQYITFASARNYYAAHFDGDAQELAATDKFHQLVSHPVFAPLYRNDWFEIQPNPTVGAASTLRPDIIPGGQDSDLFHGTSTAFVAHMLDFRIPFFGSTSSEEGGFRTHISSYLGREPTHTECQIFTTERWERIKALSDVYRNGTYPRGGSYFQMMDNGC